MENDGVNDEIVWHLVHEIEATMKRNKADYKHGGIALAVVLEKIKVKTKMQFEINLIEEKFKPKLELIKK